MEVLRQPCASLRLGHSEDHGHDHFAGQRPHSGMEADRSLRGEITHHRRATSSMAGSYPCITDIVARARVSRTVMYREFDGKLDCFLAAIEAGRELITARIAQAMDEVADDTLEPVLRASFRAYLEACSREPEHARAWVLELAAAGPEGVEAKDRYLDGFAGLMKQIACRYGSGRARPDEQTPQLVGGITELVGRAVRTGSAASLPHLEDALTEAAVAMLR